MKFRFYLVLLVLATVTAKVEAQESVSLNKIFRRQADVIAEASGLVRLELPAEVIAECRGDLSDLRILDRQDREVPFLLDSLADDSAPAVSEAIPAAIVEANRKELRPAEAGRPALRQESFDIRLPADFSRDFEWSLVFKTTQTSFTRKVEIETLTAENAYPGFLTNASIFRLPNIPAEKLRLPLSEVGTRLLRVTLEGEGDAYLEPQIFLEKSKAAPERRNIEIPLQELSRQREGNKISIRIRKPAGWNFETLKLSSPEYVFQYRVRVFREEDGASESLGEASLFRLESEGRPESTELPLVSSLGSTLRVEIENRGPSTMENLSFIALMRQPALVFPVSTAPSPKARLLFGGNRAFPPDYDLTPILTLLQSEARGDEARQRLQILPKARLENLRPNPDFDSKPALEFAMRPGAEIDARLYRHQRDFYANASSDGLSLITLQPEDLAVAKPDLSDLRVVDKQNRQWPYLLEKGQSQESVGFGLQYVQGKPGSSNYDLKLVKGPMTLSRLELSIPKAFFDRPYRLLQNPGKADETLLAEGRLTRRAGQTGNLSIAFAPTRTDSLRLVIEDGDDQALSIASASAPVDLPTLYLVAPSGSYRLLSGYAEAMPPRYELAKARDLVLRVQGGLAEMRELTINPDYNSNITSGEGMKSRPWLLWGVLIAAVLGLGIYNLRMVRKG